MDAAQAIALRAWIDHQILRRFEGRVLAVVGDPRGALARFAQKDASVLAPPRPCANECQFSGRIARDSGGSGVPDNPDRKTFWSEATLTKIDALVRFCIAMPPYPRR
jgi:hypothetical protein